MKWALRTRTKSTTMNKAESIDCCEKEWRLGERTNAKRHKEQTDK